ncbi:MAG: peptidoglycan DD-metalloendopeptidase family protein [Candidatus Margulisiibacteriota bacterium]
MRVFAALLLLISVCSLGAQSEKIAAQYQKEPELEQVELQAIQKKIKESRKKLKKTKAEEQAVLGRLVVINKELKRTKNNLYFAQKNIRTNETQIGALTSELHQTENDLIKREKGLKERVREVFKSSGLNYLELLIASRSMSDFVNRLYFFRKIINYDAGLVGGVRADLQKVKQNRSILQYRTREIRSLAKVIAEKKKDIATKADEKKKIYKSLKQRRMEYEARIAELEKSSKELEVLILKKVAARRGGKVLGSGKLAWPLRGRITSRFGYRRHPFWGGRHFHTGLDIANKYGTPVKAADAGEVIFSGWWDGYGKAIVVDHGRKTTTVYGHLSRIYKRVGAVVAKGQVVGLVGSTGYSTGPHLHFEVRKNGKPINPMKFL